MRLDAHQHFWQFDPVRDAWINEDMVAIKRDFMPADLKPVLVANNVDGCIAVQADQSEIETAFLLNMADENRWIKGVVGWVDLLRNDLSDRLNHYKANRHFKGVRHILQAEASGFMAQTDFIKGVAEVGRQELSYDILTNEKQLDEVIELIEKLPAMRLVIDHISKPDIKSQSFDHWAKSMKKISAFDHVYVKLSGMVTEADWKDWSLSDLEPYVHFCLEHFTASRLMFGSDWPVSLLAGSYNEVINVLSDSIAELSPSEQQQVMGATATEFYQLSE